MKLTALPCALAALAAVASPSWASRPSPPRPAAAAASAIVGKAAPDFTLPDLDGKPVKLSAFKGKTVVLEWFNPGCPFVKKSHSAGSLVDTAKRHAKNGVVWLAINSSAPGTCPASNCS